MAQTIYSDIGVAQAGGVNNGGALNSAQRQEARTFKSTAIVTLTTAQAAALAANDVFYLVRVASGTLVGLNSTYTTTGVGATTCTISVGDTDTVGGTVSADAARYGAAANYNAAVTTPTFLVNGTATNAPAEIVDDNTWITATVATLTGTATAARVIRWEIETLSNV